MHKLVNWGVGLALILGLAACSSGENGGGATRLHGVDLENKIVRIGALNAESGPVAVIGKPYAVGKRMLAAQINDGRSGLLPEGWKVELIERDHGYNPQRSVQLFNEIRDDVLFIATSFGTPPTLPLRPMLERNKIVAFPASLSSKMAEFAWTPPIAPSYVVEAQRALDWVINTAGGTEGVKLGVIYQQDDYGKDGLDGWKAAAQHYGLTLAAEETYAPGQADFTAPVNALKQAGATHVMLATVPSATGPILGTASQLDYNPVWIGNTPSWIDRFFDPEVIPAKIFKNYYMVTGLPYWGEPSNFMKQFLELYEKYGRDQSPPDGYILMSYLQGRVAIEALRLAISRNDLTREGYLTALQTLKDYNVDGAVAYSLSMTTVPYVVGVETRVLKPVMDKRNWQLIAPYKAPAALKQGS